MALIITGSSLFVAVLAGIFFLVKASNNGTTGVNFSEEEKQHLLNMKEQKEKE